MHHQITGWTLAASIALSANAFAQTGGGQSPPSRQDNMRSEPADSPARDGTNRAQPPVPGANSFTEGQARSRIESHGYQQIGELRKDDQSIWHARAQKNGKPVEVQLDFKGNVVEK